VSYNPYGVAGSIIVPPRSVMSSPRGFGSRSKRFGNIVVKRADGTIVATIENSPAVKLARKVAKPTLDPKIDLVKIERENALAERKALMAQALARPAEAYL
jgi:hypothetical protein